VILKIFQRFFISYVVEKLLGDIYEFKAQHKKALLHRHKAIIAAKHEGSGYSKSSFSVTSKDKLSAQQHQKLNKYNFQSPCAALFVFNAADILLEVRAAILDLVCF
jgi:hypothetical protein